MSHGNGRVLVMIYDRCCSLTGYVSVRWVITLMIAYWSVFSAEDTAAQDFQNFENFVRPAKFQGGIGPVVGIPTGEFGENVTEPGIGITGYGGYRLPGSPAIIGLSIGYMVYGRESRRERFSLTIPDVTVRVVTENNIVVSDLFLRLQQREGVLRPYVEGLLGFHYLFTKTSINDIPTLYENDIASSVNFDDVAFTYGGSAGFMIRLYDGTEKRQTRPGSVKTVSLDFRIRYLNGSNASYLKRGDLVRSSGTVTLNTTRSRTNITTIFLGVAVDI